MSETEDFRQGYEDAIGGAVHRGRSTYMDGWRSGVMEWLNQLQQESNNRYEYGIEQRERN